MKINFIQNLLTKNFTIAAIACKKGVEMGIGFFGEKKRQGLFKEKTLLQFGAGKADNPGTGYNQYLAIIPEDNIFNHDAQQPAASSAFIPLTNNTNTAAFMKTLLRKSKFVSPFIASLFFASTIFGQTITFSNPANNTLPANTWKAPAGITSVTIEVWGGGGKGGSRTTVGEAGGGGGGGYSKKVVPVTAGNIYTVNVGGGSTTTAAGGESWFFNNTTVLARGGNSVLDNTVTGGSGASVGIGDVGFVFSGGSGRIANLASTNAGGGGSSAGTNANGVTATSTTGATAPTGGGNGGNGAAGNNTDGSPGIAPGGGGGGADKQGSVTFNGGNGANGQVKITWACSNTLTSAPGTEAQSVCKNTPITNVVFTIAGATGATVSGLPAGVTGSYNTTTGQFTISGSPSVTGSFDYIITPTGSCTSSIITGLIYIFQPTVSLSNLTPVSGCVGYNIPLTLSASVNEAQTPFGYQWKLNGVDIPSANGSTYVIPMPITTAGTSAYSVVLTDGCGTSVTSLSKIYTINADPVSQTINPLPASGSSICIGGSVSATFSGGSGGSGTISENYLISINGAAATAYTPGALITATSAGTILITTQRKASSTGSTGCTDGAVNSVTWTVVADPTWATNTVTPITICAGGQVTFSATVSGGSGGTLTWIRSTTPGGIGATVTSPNTEATAGTFYYRPRYNPAVSGCNLVDGTETTITVNQPVTPSVSISQTAGSNPTCTGSSVTFTGTATNTGGGTVNYTFKEGATVLQAASTSNTFTTSALSAGAHIITCDISITGGICLTATTATAATGASITVNQTVTPSVSIAQTTGTDPTCAGSSVTFTATATNTGGGTVNYTFKEGATVLQASSISNTFTTSALSGGVHTITCDISITGGICLTATTATAATGASITVNTAPVITGQPTSQTVTYGAAASFAVSSTGTAPLTYQWQANAGAGFSNISLSGIYANTDANDATLEISLPTVSMSGYKYRCIVTGICAPVATSDGNATLIVNKKTASVTPVPATKVYGSIDPTFTGNLTGFLIADNVTVSYSRSAGETVSGSPYQISAILSPSDVLANYSITYNTANLAITTLAVTVTAEAKTKTYGSLDPALTFVSNPAAGSLLANGDAITYSGSLARLAGENVGSYAINQGSVANSNYAITYTGANLTITTLAVTVTAEAKTKTYGSLDPALTFVSNPAVGSLLANGDAINYSGSLARLAGENVGSYAINQGNLANSNYNITYTGGTFTITQLPVTVTANAGQTKVYGAANPASYTYTSVPAVGAVLANLDVVGFTGSQVRAGGENVGPYAISQGNLANSNYNITYTGGTFTITAAPEMASVSVSPANQQSSDKVSYSSTLIGGAPLVIGGPQAAVSATFKVGTQVIGTAPFIVSGLNLVASLDDRTIA